MSRKPQNLTILTNSPPSPSSPALYTNDSDAIDDLPYPEALPHSDFLTEDFNPSSYLSTLSTRHQTLEDLRSDLRERSQLLSAELLDLVNSNYEAFLSLGSELKGGEERVEDVRVGLLGFGRGVGEVREKVSARGEAVDRLLVEGRMVKGEIELGRGLLEVWDRVGDLEDRLVVKSATAEAVEWSDSDDSDVEEEQDGNGAARVKNSSVRNLEGLGRDWTKLDEVVDGLPLDHPFLKSLDARIFKVRSTLLLDLGAALKGAKRDVNSKEEGGGLRLMRILACFEEMGEEREAVRVLRSGRV